MLLGGAGDRLSQSVGGEVTTYTLDLYGGLTQVLGDGASVYLYGLGRIGEEGAAGWLTHLGDALGSVRQLADADGEVVEDRSYRPYGGVLDSGGSGGSAYGFAGEWTDGTGLVFLRARYMDPRVGRFVTRDMWPGSVLRPVTFSGYLYADGDPFNRVDPTGLCAIVGATDCERFVSEVRCLIGGLRDARECHGWLKLIPEKWLVLDLLAQYYSGIPSNVSFVGGELWMPFVPQGTTFQPGDPDRWKVPDWDQSPGFEWDHPINQSESDLGRDMRQAYGFRRPYFAQTHHYFAFLKFAYFLPDAVVESEHKQREIEDQLIPALRLWQEHTDNPRYAARYAWVYRESVYDLYIVHEAIELARAVGKGGVDAIPKHFEASWCAIVEGDVWSLENQVDQFYFDFPKEFWPSEQHWPGR
jgi:RHS repeat-associated protein